jgi:3-oxoacyl-(acyl-carrier-protein) synthase
VKPVRPDTPVLVGAGLASALAYGVGSTLEALSAGRTAISPLAGASPPGAASMAALVASPELRAPVPASLEPQIKFLNGAGRLAVEAATEAWERAGGAATARAGEAQGLWLSQMDAWDWSCIELRPAFAEASGEFSHAFDGPALNRASPGRVKPFFLLESLKNNAFSFLANCFDLRGPNTSVAGYAGATAPLLDFAARAVSRGEEDRALVVAAGRATAAVARRDLVLWGLREPGADAAYRPLDGRGQGLLPGEGAAAVVIERFGDARGGPSPPVALLGFGAATGDPLPEVPAPAEDAVRGAVLDALADAEVRPGDLLAVVVPSIGRPVSDRALLRGLDAAALVGVPVVCWRGAFGHLALAADLADLVVAAAALTARSLPGTVGLREPLEPRVARSAVTGDAAAVLVVGAGIHGEASAVVVTRTGT